MYIHGVVEAVNERDAEKILLTMVNENILLYFELDGEKNIPFSELVKSYDSHVSNDGYLNLFEDADWNPRKLFIHPIEDSTYFGFYAEAVGKRYTFTEHTKIYSVKEGDLL